MDGSESPSVTYAGDAPAAGHAKVSAIRISAACLLDEGLNLRGILDALAGLDATAHIHRVGTHLAHRVSDVLRSQPAREDQWLCRILGHQAPVESLAGATGRARNKGVEKDPGGRRVARDRRGDVVTRLDSQCLDVWTAVTCAVVRAFIAMELQQVQR